MFSKYTLLPLLHHLDLVSSLDRIGCVILKTQELEGNLYKVATNQDLKAANYYLFSRYTLYSAIFFIYISKAKAEKPPKVLERRQCGIFLPLVFCKNKHLLQ